MTSIRFLILGLALSLLGVGGVAAGGTPLTAEMTGAQEFPGPGDPNGVGFASFTINQGQGVLCYKLYVEDITLPATAAHIHPGAAGTANPPIINLEPPDETGYSEGCTPASKELLKAIRKNPEAYYVNVHTSDFGPGAVRGQLSR